MKSMTKTPQKGSSILGRPLVIFLLVAVFLSVGLIVELRLKLESVQSELDRFMDGLGDKINTGSNSTDDLKDFCAKEVDSVTRKLKKELNKLERNLLSASDQTKNACDKKLVVAQSELHALQQSHDKLTADKTALERKLIGGTAEPVTVCDQNLTKINADLEALRMKYKKLSSEKADLEEDSGNSCDDLKKKIRSLKDAFDNQMQEKIKMASVLKACEGSNMWNATVLNSAATKAAQDAIAQCGKASTVATFGKVMLIPGNKLYGCEATEAEINQYLNYTKRADCPDDWYFVQKLIFFKHCHALPKRFCYAKTSSERTEPLPFPNSVWNQSSLVNENVRWSLHDYRSFDEVIGRSLGDCKNCFNLTKESTRWGSSYHGTIPIRKVVAMKQGSLRIGLDLGGGTGSFAARMATYNCTILTTAMNTETLGPPDKWKGLPYMETIALRGLVPLHLPHQARLPFFDNTLDIIHTMNTIKYFTMPQFEELVFDWDRVLRPGGIMWFEMFYAPVSEMPLYITIIELFKYKKLYWVLTPKTDIGERAGEHVYLNCVLEKPERP